MKNFIQLFFLISFLFPANILLADIEKGKWNYVKEMITALLVVCPLIQIFLKGKKEAMFIFLYIELIKILRRLFK